MKPITLSVALFLASMMSCSVYKQDLVVSQCNEEKMQPLAFSKADAITEQLHQIVMEGVPGVGMAVYSNDEGWWEDAVGYSKIEDQSPMKTCHLQYLQSVSKTYMSVAILKLHEQGKINLDEPMSLYLPAKYCKYITDADKITLRMLLNHTSGVPEYNSVPAYVSLLLQQPDHAFTAEDYLRYIDGKPLDFVPGSKFSYRNTNYVILALIADAIVGDHAKFITESIIKPLGLTHTFYRDAQGYPNYPDIPNTYWDRYSDGILENVSQLQRNNVASLIGDDGILTTPHEAVQFLKALIGGELIAPSSLEQMMTWVNDAKGHPTYGLGLDHSMFVGHKAYGHSGGGIGAGCQLYYFPDKDIYAFIGINLGTVTESPLHKEAMKTLDKIYTILLD